jgi:hypothetical protein
VSLEAGEAERGVDYDEIHIPLLHGRVLGHGVIFTRQGWHGTRQWGQSTYAILMGPKSTAVLALMYTSVYLDTYAPCSLD